MTTTAPTEVAPQDFKQALARFLSGITVVTVEIDGEIHGMTASAFISVSLSPPLVLVSVDKRARMHAMLDATRRFGVSLLPEGTEAVSNHFAGRAQDGLAIAWHREGFDTPVMADALAGIDCDLHEALDAGDHTLYLGRVKQVRYADGEPLAYYRGRYRALKP